MSFRLYTSIETECSYKYSSGYRKVDNTCSAYIAIAVNGDKCVSQPFIFILAVFELFSSSVAAVMGKTRALHSSIINHAAVVSITCAFVLVCCGSLSRMTCAKDVFASSAHLKVLAEGEKNLMQSLHQYIDDEIERLDHIDRLVKMIGLFSNPPSANFS